MLKIIPFNLLLIFLVVVIRDINDKEREWIKELSNNYVELSKQYLSI